MALKDFFTSVFSRPDETAQLADLIWQSSLQAADDYVRQSDAVEPKCSFGVAVSVACGLLHLADRMAFGAIPGRRAKVMDRLGARVAALIAHEAISAGFPSERKKEAMEKVLSEMNDAGQVYGQCKNVAPKGDESMKGTLLWEFGKRFAEAANKSMDVAAITFGSSILMTTAMKINIREKILAC